MSEAQERILNVENLTVEYASHGWGDHKIVRANDDISIHINAGETLGIVGESGSGKSTLGDAILGFAPVTQGTITFQGEDISHASPKRRRELTREIQVIFQNPFGSLNPSRTIGQILAEPLLAHGLESDSAARSRKILEWLDMVGLPASSAGRYPGDFSGGQRQRVAIARALLVEPELVVCDEAVSALDVSIQAQVLNLLMDLQKRLGVSYLFITHDLAVVEHISQRIAVMHRGRIVETGETHDVITSPREEYTRALLDAVPSPDPTEQRRRRRERTAP